jgi:polyferredoxin
MATQIRPETGNPQAFVPAKELQVRRVPRKKLVRRRARDHSQTIRHSFQLLFLGLNLYIGTLFYVWVRHIESGSTLSLARPAGVEGWLPIAGLMNLKYFALTGSVPAVHPAAMFLLVSFLAIALLLRKAFCSWLCPVGTISEYLWRFGQLLLRRNFRLPRWIDLSLRSLKYVLLAFFVWAVAGMSAREIASFMAGPYGLIADVKMLNFFRFLGATGLVVIGFLVLGSILVQNFWCRYLCPYGALLGLAALPGPLRIRRQPEACVDCARCARACPSQLPVDRLISIRSAECTGCVECIAACPAEGALRLTPAGTRRSVPAWLMATAVAAFFLATISFAKLTGHWTTHVPADLQHLLVLHANEVSHPMPGH